MQNNRTRMVSFRLSEDEYERLKDLSIAERARSVSEFARSVLCELPGWPSGLSGVPVPRVSKLEGAVRELTGDVHQLHKLVEVALGGNQKRSDGAGPRESGQ